MVRQECMATVGAVSNAGQFEPGHLGKAGRKRWISASAPAVRGVA
jgi:ribosomal protein L2